MKDRPIDSEVENARIHTMHTVEAEHESKSNKNEGTV